MIDINCYYFYIIIYHKWFKELPTEEDSATTPSPTKSEKLEHQDPKLSSSTPAKEDTDPGLPSTAANAEKDSTVSLNSDPITTKDLPKKTSTSQDHTVESFAEDASNQESSEPS